MTETAADIAAVTLIAIAFFATALAAITSNRSEEAAVLRPVTVDAKIRRRNPK